MTGARSLAANFSLNSYDITASANPTAGGTVTGAGTYEHGSSCTLTAEPNEGYYFMYWKKGNSLVSTNPSISFEVTCEAAYTAYFDIFTYYVEAYPEPDEYGSISGAGDYAHGTTCVLTANAIEGYHLASWTIDEEVVSTESVYSFTVLDNVEVVAHFEINSYEITAGANLEEGGTITGSGTYSHGAMVTLTATTNEGYTFVNWTENGEEVSDNSTYSFTATEERVLVANFSRISYSITATADPSTGGSATGTGTYYHGENVTLVATPNDGYSFINWTKNGEEVSTNATFTFAATSAGDYVANFSFNSYEITATANPSGSCTITGAGTYDHGATVTLTAVGNTGYIFLNWTKDNEEVSSTPSFSFTATESGTYVANFLPKTYSITVKANPTAGGTVTGGGNHSHGTTCTLTAEPNEGYYFLYWKKSGEIVSTSPTYSFEVTGGGIYTAYFSIINYDVDAYANPAEGGTISGAGTYEMGETATLTATPNQGYEFVNWTEDGVVVSTEATYSFTVTGNRTLVANFEMAGVTNTFTLSGWNWWSANQDVTLNDVYVALGNHSTSIVSQNGSNTYLDGLGWDGDIDAIDLAKMYKIYVNGSIEVTLNAPAADPAQHPITIKKGINWIGYPCQETMAVKDALAGLNATSGDRIKSEGKTATFLGSSWTGTLKNLEPNHGYLYTAKAAKSFTYPTGAKATQLDIEEPTSWTPERTRFASNMNVLALLNLDGVDQTSPDIEIGAFVNGECRDAVRIIHFEETGQDLALFTISGENGETVHFKALVNGNAIDLVETVTVQLDGMVGDFDRPFVLHNAAELNLFPNPADKEERIRVDLPYWIERTGAKVEVYNALGALVASETVNGNVTELQGFKVTGLYTIKVTDQLGNTCYGKLVVK